MRVLLTGATGYVGGRLAPMLLQRGHEVTCLVRSPRKLEDRNWARDPRVTVVPGDLGETETVRRAAAGCDVAYYLVHSMEAGTDDFLQRDRELAQSFVEAVRNGPISRIIYLGGLGELGEDLSEHLSSRRDVERVLEASGVPLTAFRAAMVLGSGSASFEILRYLVERLPVMLTPRWVRTRCQPISIVDVIGYLLDCLEAPETAGRRLDIGGPDVLSYRELMRIMADELGLQRRTVIELPVLTPRLSSAWIGLVTPVSPSIARPLAEGLRNEVVVRTGDADALLPRERLGVREAIRRGVERTRASRVTTRWSTAGVVPGDPDWAGGTTFVDRRTRRIDASASSVYRAVCRVGGGHGWYAADVLWRIRGLMDQAVGGPGLRRGRRDPETIGYGEALDFWRATDVQPDRVLELRAEMKLPGTAELRFEVDPQQSTTELTMQATFRPRGLFGLAYWYAVLPFHAVVFKGMLAGIQRAAEQIEPEGQPA